MWSRQTVLIGVMSSLCANSNAFLGAPSSFGVQRAFSLRSESDGVEQIEFKIYPDGRVEETVRGIKGNNCHKVTEKINEALGDVTATRPTEELYEQELVIDQTITQTQGTSDWEGGSTW